MTRGAYSDARPTCKIATTMSRVASQSQLMALDLPGRLMTAAVRGPFITVYGDIQ